MLFSDFKENENNCIELESEDPAVVKLYVHLLYEGEANWPSFAELVIPLLRLAHQYQVHSIVDMCETFLIRNIATHDPFEVYGLAKLLGTVDLIFMSFEYIKRWVRFVLRIPPHSHCGARFMALAHCDVDSLALAHCCAYSPWRCLHSSV